MDVLTDAMTSHETRVNLWIDKKKEQSKFDLLKKKVEVPFLKYFQALYLNANVKELSTRETYVSYCVLTVQGATQVT